jgi:WhiB family redox-sensing transcriptional regulator
VASVVLDEVGSLTEPLRPPERQRDGLCLEHPEVEFFPERGQDSRPAKAVCAACLVRRECAAFALEHRIQHGIWGGTSERERRGLRPAARPGRRTAAA